MDFPQIIPVKQIDAHSSDYDQHIDSRRTAEDLFKGGDVLKFAVQQRGLYLLQKPKEMSEVFRVRQQRFSYTNLMSNILGWYATALFKTPAQLVKKREGAEGDQATVIPTDAQQFCDQFEQDADRAGTSFNDFFRGVFESLSLHKQAYILIDLPMPDDDAPAPLSLGEQTKAGLLDPYLVLYKPTQVINWETDAYGNLEWCIVAVSVEEREPLKEPKMVDYWYYFDRDQVICYSAEHKEKRSDEDKATMVAGYPRKHAMSNLKRIPIRKIEVPDGLWLANRVYLPLLNHLNMDNAYDFALFQSALAQLVISGDYEDNPLLSEVAYIKLNAGSKAEYLEPEGRAYEAISKRLEALEERIYKACFLLDQARTNKSTPTAQSGLSKQQDKTPSRDALSGFGDVIRPAMQHIYEDVLLVREIADVVPDVRGFDWQDKAGIEEMDFLEKSTIVDIQSDTFRRERDMKITRLVLPDINPETQAKIDAEITTNPTPEAALALQQEQAAAKQIDSFTQTFKDSGQTPN